MKTEIAIVKDRKVFRIEAPHSAGVPGTPYLTAGRTRGNQGENGHCG